MAVAIPALIAYFASLSVKRIPISHIMRFIFLQNDSLSLEGVWMVFGAWGRTFGKNGWEALCSGMMYAAALSELTLELEGRLATRTKTPFQTRPPLRGFTRLSPTSNTMQCLSDSNKRFPPEGSLDESSLLKSVYPFHGIHKWYQFPGKLLQGKDEAVESDDKGWMAMVNDLTSKPRKHARDRVQLANCFPRERRFGYPN